MSQSQDKKIGVGAGVGIMILKDNKVLLGRRNDDPDKADSKLHGEGTWTMPGGKIHFHESFEQAASRELAEETGIKIEQDKLKFISITNDHVSDAHFVTIGFLCKEFEGDAKVMEPNEITEWRWFDLNDLPEKVFFPSAKILKNYLDNVYYKH
ncbi:NUDIX domain-containing protein [Candidatus Parcubacteria bacterium]|nr:NUDIX domain-containing protein [Candidatus Parcubacteria bacterium]